MKLFTEAVSVSQRRGVISLISKNDSDQSELTGWCPIRLLNVDLQNPGKVYCNLFPVDARLTKAWDSRDELREMRVRRQVDRTKQR